MLFYSDLIKIPRVLLNKESPGKIVAGIAGSIIYNTRIYRGGDRKQNRRFLLHLILY